MNETPIFAIVGPPGTGKTTTLAQKAGEAVERFGPTSVLIASLTKAAAAEAASRIAIPENRVGTLHSHAYRALGGPTIAETKISSWNQQYPQWRITRASKDTDVPPDPYPEDSKGDQVFSLYTLLRARLVSRNAWPDHVERFAAQWEGFKDDAGLLDFEDLIERARLDTEFAPGYPRVIYGDEAQDWSRSELELCLHWAKHTDGLVLLGDWHQALYVWRGADPHALRTLDVPTHRRNVLKQSYRVPRVVQQAAVCWLQRLSDYEEVEYNPRPAEGVLRRLMGTYRKPEIIIADDIERISEQEGRSVMVLGACAYHLDPLIQVLRQRGLPFQNVYRRKNGRWNPLGNLKRVKEFLRPDTVYWGEKARVWTWKEVHTWFQCIDSGHLQRGAKEHIKRMAENEHSRQMRVGATVERALESIAVHFKTDPGLTIDAKGIAKLESMSLKRFRRSFEFPARIARMRGTDVLKRKPRITIGTIHSVKGGQADVVYLFPDLSRRGYDGWRWSGGESRDAVVRLFYVGMTRAREELVLCDAADGMAVDL